MLAGSWRYVVGGGPDLPDHTMTFTPFGDLVQSVLVEEGVESRILLMYEVDGDTLVMDQPNALEPERKAYVVDADELRIGADDPAVYRREPHGSVSDPDAYMLALASAALHRALSQASDAESFVPFLISDDLENRTVRRILAPDVHVARGAAQNTMTTLGADVHAAAFAFQGVVEIEGEAFDAAVVEVSQRGRLYGLLLGQPFGRNEEGHLVRITDLDVETNENWFEVDHPSEKKRKPAKKAVAKKPAAKKTVAKKASVKKVATKKSATKKAATKKAAAKRPAAKKAIAKKAVAKKTAVKRPSGNKAVAKKAVTKKTARKQVPAARPAASKPAKRKARR
jgi:hypothetical protein